MPRRKRKKKRGERAPGPGKLTKWERQHRNYTKSGRWRKFRAEILAERNHRCEKCGSDERLQVHHVHYRTYKNERPQDVEVLCGRCHRREHFPRFKAPLSELPRYMRERYWLMLWKEP